MSEPLFPRLIRASEVMPGDRIALDLGRVKTARRERSTVMLYQESRSHDHYQPDRMFVLLHRSEPSYPSEEPKVR